MEQFIGGPSFSGQPNRPMPARLWGASWYQLIEINSTTTPDGSAKPIRQNDDHVQPVDRPVQDHRGHVAPLLFYAGHDPGFQTRRLPCDFRCHQAADALHLPRGHAIRRAAYRHIGHDDGGQGAPAYDTAADAGDEGAQFGQEAMRTLQGTSPWREGEPRDSYLDIEVQGLTVAGGFSSLGGTKEGEQETPRIPVHHLQREPATQAATRIKWFGPVERRSMTEFEHGQEPPTANYQIPKDHELHPDEVVTLGITKHVHLR